MTVKSSVQNEKLEFSPEVESPSIGGVSLEVEDTHKDLSKPTGTSLSFGPIKLFMTLWNFKSFVLVIWGFWGVIDSTLRAGQIESISQYVEKNSLQNTITDYEQIECFHVGDSDEVVRDQGHPIFYPYLMINLCWMLWIVVRSNILWYRTDELGFHICWVEIRKKFAYKVWAMVVFVYVFCSMVYGVQQLSQAEGHVQSRSFPIFFNGVFQVFLGLWALYSPLEETLSYGEGAMVSPINCSMFDEAGKAIERYQDALLAALARGKSNLKYMEEATGATKEECEQILFDISAKEHSSEMEFKGFSFC